ncbi:alcohol dehydrogenase [Fusarium denticulatum]|uniref:Alcohol dehydrogenase n=1 Tax=Fusarium denticulatum TaxID=48507 RepID=A0A8H5TWX1_9HYPO|nr:alcohol dehydrogenase [Fusarium denticulatum]
MGFQTAPKPKTPLGLHRILSPTAGVKVSPICLGGISIGHEWKFYTGKNEEPFKLLDAFYDIGGNFIDTANLYNNQESEKLIGQWMEERDVRDQMVIATKYSAGYRAFGDNPEPLQSNFTGNSAKSMHISVRDSLKKLRTDYIDILYVHWWDYATPVEEVMRGLHVLVMQGKVLYLGISNTPAWIVVKANAYARQHGLTPFCVYQGNWNAALRDIEGDVIPMCEDQDMAIVSWGSLGTGSLLTAQQRKEREADPDAPKPQISEVALKTSEALERIADRKGTTLQAIALAYLFHQTTYVFPIVGVNTVEHIKAMPDALKIKLSKEEADEIHEASPYNPGYPLNHQQYQMAAWIDAPPKRLKSFTQQSINQAITQRKDLQLTFTSILDPFPTMRLTTIFLALQSIGLISARAISHPGLRVETFVNHGSSFDMVSSLIIGSQAAVLIDLPMAIEGAEALADWVLNTTDKPLVAAFTTHFHPDHYLSGGALLSRFPEAKYYANSKAAAEIKKEAAHKVKLMKGVLGEKSIVNKVHLPTPYDFSFFTLPGDEATPIHFLNPLTGDTVDETLFWIPSIKTLIAGDSVYGHDMHLWLADSLTKALTGSWLSTLDLIDYLKPNVVVPGHSLSNKKFGCSIDVDHTRAYLKYWQKEIEAKGLDHFTPQVIFDKFNKQFPGLLNLNSSTSAFLLNSTAEQFGRGGTRQVHYINLAAYNDIEALDGWTI